LWWLLGGERIRSWWWLQGVAVGELKLVVDLAMELGGWRDGWSEHGVVGGGVGDAAVVFSFGRDLDGDVVPEHGGLARSGGVPDLDRRWRDVGVFEAVEGVEVVPRCEHHRLRHGRHGHRVGHRVVRRRVDEDRLLRLRLLVLRGRAGGPDVGEVPLVLGRLDDGGVGLAHR
jgi:hypothetical protein